VLPRLDEQRAGDVLIGLSSSGPHSNGYSLIRRIVERSGLGWDAPAPFEAGKTLAEALMAPTRIYVKSVLPLMKAGLVKGGAHITGGGLIENPPRCVAEGLVPVRLGRLAAAARCSSGCRRRAGSPTTRCAAPSTAASAWC
jgi:phosphoribosylaminoimidazole (AIR) synthetase